MRKLSILLLLFFSSIVYAGDPSILTTDDRRGPWFDTIDEGARSYAYNRVTDIKRAGKSSLRFEVKSGDCYTAYPENPSQGWDDCTRDRERSEVREKFLTPWDTSYWYKISVYIPKDYNFIYPKQIIFQWHNKDQPNAFLSLNKSKLKLDILTEPNLTTKQYDILDVVDKNLTGKWIDIVFNVRWSEQPDGFLKMYLNNALVVNYVGATAEKGIESKSKGLYVKYGIYRSHIFRYEKGACCLPTQILYFDEYARGPNRIAINNNRAD